MAADLEFYKHERSDNSVSGFQMFWRHFNFSNEAKKFKSRACECLHTHGSSCMHQALWSTRTSTSFFYEAVVMLSAAA